MADDYDVEVDGWDEDVPMGEADADDPTVQIENNFIEAEELMKSDMQEALEKFQCVIDLESTYDLFNFSFQSQKNIVILAMQLSQFDTMIEAQKNLLRMSQRSTPNDMSEAINAVQDAIAKYLQNQPHQAEEMYKLILGNLKAGNQRLWFSTSLRLGKIYLDEKEFDQLEKLILELKEPCRDANNPVLFDMSKGNFLLEVFALEIQMCIERKEQRRMKEVFALTEKFSSVIEDNRVKIIIQECGGKMFMTEKKWDSALKSFKGCFEAMAETGHLRAPTLLKYVILTQLLSKNDLDYMGQREAQIYKDHPEIVAMRELKQGFEKNDIKPILAVIADKKINLLSDPLIATYLEDFLRTVRLKALVSFCKPYKAVKLEFLARQLNIDVNEIRALLAELILEEKIKGQIDQIAGVLELQSNELKTLQKHTAIRKWAETLVDLNRRLTSKVNYEIQARGIEGSRYYDMDEDIQYL